MTMTPQHPSEMGLNVNDVIRYEESSGAPGYTVGQNYPVLECGYLASDFGVKHLLNNVDSDRRFTLVSRADDGWLDMGTVANLEYRMGPQSQPQYRPRKPVVEQVAVTGYVTETDGVRDWATFSEKEDL